MTVSQTEDPVQLKNRVNLQRYALDTTKQEISRSLIKHTFYADAAAKLTQGCADFN